MDTPLIAGWLHPTPVFRQYRWIGSVQGRRCLGWPIRCVYSRCGKLVRCCVYRNRPCCRHLPQGDRSASWNNESDEVTCGTDEEIIMNHVLDVVDAGSLRDDIPPFRAGDSVKVYVKVVEGSRSRVQIFAGVVISRVGGGIREAFTVRKVSFGTGVERTFPLHSPIIEKIEVERHGDVRRAKLYYLRGLRGKAAKIKEKRFN